MLGFSRFTENAFIMFDAWTKKTEIFLSKIKGNLDFKEKLFKNQIILMKFKRVKHEKNAI